MCSKNTRMCFHLPSPLYSSFLILSCLPAMPPDWLHPDRIAAAWANWLGASARPPPLEGIITHSWVWKAGGAARQLRALSFRTGSHRNRTANKQGSNISILLPQQLTLPHVLGYIDILWIREDTQSIFFSRNSVCSYVPHPWSCSSHSDTCMKWDFCRKKNRLWINSNQLVFGFIYFF